MEEGKEKYETFDNSEQDKLFSRAIRAGKRTYFFDVKVTKSDDFYLTITESKKRYQNDGRYFYEKHKIFLFKEDFDKFMEGIEDAIDYVQNAKSIVKNDPPSENETAQDYTNVEFDDLEKVDVTFNEESKE